jgi:RNA polymerase sigma-70 factor (ECF subfamily)
LTVQPFTETSIDEPAIARLVACGSAANPGITEPAALRALLASRIAQGSTEDLAARAADLYLATACIAGDAAAIASLDASLPTVVRPALAGLGLPVSDDDEIIQRVRVALLVRDQAGACGLAGYSGRGELRAYLRAVAVRIALKRLEREASPADDQSELLALLPDANDSPELTLLKQRCRDDLREGFASALASLTPRERTLLRQHYVDGLTVDVLGRLHRVHRSTCARWIEAVRVKVLGGLRGHLKAKLGLDAAELDDAVALVRSQLDLSLSRHLTSRDS